MKAIPHVTIPRDLTSARARTDILETAQTAQVSIPITKQEMLIWQQKHLWPERVNELHFDNIHFVLIDIDECTIGTQRCDVNAVCNNVLGSYNCTCNDGFHGNGTNCTGEYSYN